jgi:hypothetical protein
MNDIGPVLFGAVSPFSGLFSLKIHLTPRPHAVYDKYITKLNRTEIGDRIQKTEDGGQKPVLPVSSEVDGRLPKEQETEMRETGECRLIGQDEPICTYFLQNKANLYQAKMNARPIMTKDYENRWAFGVEQKQSQSKPI